jgi:Zn-dependent protease
MFGPSIKVFTFFGFEVRVDASWLIIAALFTWPLAVGVFPARYADLPREESWWMGIVGTLGLFGSVVVHELFHSLGAAGITCR